MLSADREARWKLGLWLVLAAANKDETETALRQALAGLDREMLLRGEPVLHLRDRHNPDIWVDELEPDLAFFQAIAPDDAKTRRSR